MDPKLKPLDQQVIVITGASSGIGLATALAAAHQGARVVLGARSVDVLDDVVAHISAEGGQAVAAQVDVSDRAQVEQLARRAIDAFGRIDTWVNNAGLSIYGRLDEVEEAHSRRLFDINFWGVVNGSLAALPHLRANGGALINLGSEASEAAVPLQAMYSASKHAVKGFTDGLRLELEADGAPVSVTLIQPTAVDTPYPEHAANYLPQEPKLPTPMIEVEKVAGAILDAATSATRSTKVGAMSVLNTAMAKFVPSLGDLMARQQIGRQQRDEAPHGRDGTLYEAGHGGRVRGRGNEHAADTTRAEAMNRHPAAREA
ncbi:MAG: SDR family oxidoreductase [Burkholderiaceae bacterium]